MRHVKSLLTVILCAAVFLQVPAVAAAGGIAAQSSFTEPRTVRVGLMESKYFSTKDSSGNYEGILIDYLDEISKYAGWKVQYIEGSQEEMMKKSLSGEVDIIGSVMKNDYTLSNYDLADYNSGYSYTTLSVKTENNSYQPMDYTSFNGMRIGVFSKAVNRIPAYEAFIKMNSLKVNTVYYDDSEKLMSALNSGEVDAMLGNDVSLAEDQKIIAKFNPVPNYFAVQKGNTHLLNELNAALATINEVNPNFDNIVYDKYIGNINRGLTFSANEQAYLKKGKKLRVAMVETLAPLEYYDSSTDKMKGICVEILEEISNLTSLQFEFIPVKTIQQAKELLHSDQADLITCLSSDDTHQDSQDIVFTKNFLTTQTVIVHN